MELPIPQLSNLETITVILFCFVIAQLVIGRRRIVEGYRAAKRTIVWGFDDLKCWAKRQAHGPSAEQLAAESAKPAFKFPADWTVNQQREFQDVWFFNEKEKLALETGDWHVYGPFESRPDSCVSSDIEYGQSIRRILQNGTSQFISPRGGIFYFRDGEFIQRTTVDAAEILGLSATEAPSQPKCPTPPNGWDCSRDIGHPGPCAASPSESSASEGGAL